MPKRKAKEGVLALDIGTSSVRAVVYDVAGVMVQRTLTDLPYSVNTTEPGQVSSDPQALVSLIADSIDGALKAATKAKLQILAVGASCYWHSLMGVNRSGRPTTELLTWADTRSGGEVRAMRQREGERAYHRRTGCFFHASYWPAKLRWLRRSRPTAVRRTAHWMSLAEYLYRELFGDAPVSISMASGTGLLDINRDDWDADAIRLAGISARKLSRLSEWDQPCRGLQPAFAKRWPELAGIPWFLPLGDGGLANVGAGCMTQAWACATIGTSSALRVLTAGARLDVPWGVFAYRLDREHFVIGGALSEGGNVMRWLTDGLGIKHRKQIEKAAGERPPDRHGLTILPFWAGERSPNWRADARAAITGISLTTQAADLMRAAMEAITYQFVAVEQAMKPVIRRPRAVIATGGQLEHSAAWSQMLADALGLPVMISPETEASSRGAALLALHALGRLPSLWSMSPSTDARFKPRKSAQAIYARARRRQERLYSFLFPAPGKAAPGATSGEPGSSSRKKDLRSRAARR